MVAGTGREATLSAHIERVEAIEREIKAIQDRIRMGDLRPDTMALLREKIGSYIDEHIEKKNGGVG